jgi:hypothetical protein
MVIRCDCRWEDEGVVNADLLGGSGIRGGQLAEDGLTWYDII